MFSNNEYDVFGNLISYECSSSSQLFTPEKKSNYDDKSILSRYSNEKENSSLRKLDFAINSFKSNEKRNPLEDITMTKKEKKELKTDIKLVKNLKSYTKLYFHYKIGH